MLKVNNLTSTRSGESVRNQFEILSEGKHYFQSYNSLIAEWDGTTLTLGCDWDYSITTMKYLYQWMQDACYRLYASLEGKSKANAIRKAIDEGRIKYDPNMQ